MCLISYKAPDPPGDRSDTAAFVGTSRGVPDVSPIVVTHGKTNLPLFFFALFVTVTAGERQESERKRERVDSVQRRASGWNLYRCAEDSYIQTSIIYDARSAR